MIKKKMANFDLIFEELMILEGGYVNNPHDPGGETNFGISKRSYPDEDIKNLTLARAKEIYYQDFWLANHYDQIKNDLLASYIFHNSVNCGASRSHLLLQRALRACHILPNADVMTLNSEINLLDLVNQASEKEGGLYLALQSESAAFRRAIPISKPTSQIFEKGWLRRSYDEMIERDLPHYPPAEAEKIEIQEPEGLDKNLWIEGNYSLFTSEILSQKLFKTSLDFYSNGWTLNDSLHQTSVLLQRALRAAHLLPKEIRQLENNDVNLITYANQIPGFIILPAFRSELAGFYRIELLKEKNLSNASLLEARMQKAYDDEVAVEI